ncbi:MAG: RagB/SusD family nutrient uptake outer membrane protein [Muribaculaceae bacterium]
MKFKYLTYSALCLGIIGLSSCKDTLDTHPTTSFDDGMVWGSKAAAQGFVYGTFNSVLDIGIATSGSCVGWEARTPNSARCSQVNEGIDGTATETGISVNTDQGVNRFGVLRRCNLIIEKAQASNVLNDAEKSEIVAYGHFLRGLVFFDQAKKIGRFVPVTKVLTLEDSLTCGIPMTKTVAESYTYVISDLEAAVAGLPETAPAGIANKYAAEVILSRACLQAYAYTGDASYLDKAIAAATDVTTKKNLSSNYGGMFNESGANDAEILWARYGLKTTLTVGSYEELIRCYPNIPISDVRTSKCPDTLKGYNGANMFEAWAIYFPTQDMVDQYLVIDEQTGEAKVWYETSQWKNNVVEKDPSSVTMAGQIDICFRNTGEPRRIPTPQDFMQLANAHPAALRYTTLKEGVTDRDLSDLMYSNRDKRFNASIVHDKDTWLGETVSTNLGGNFSMGVRAKEDGGWYNTTTGYYWRKGTNQNPEPRAVSNTKVDYHFCLARVGEAYMNLAEAQLLKGNVTEAVAALNATRTVHGGLPASKAATLEDAWTDYMRERRVEMASENQDMYFTYLRWGKYGGYSNYGRNPGDIIYDLDRPVYKIEISQDRKSILINQLTLLNSASRKFTLRRYLFPIPQGFLNTREAYGLDHEQNELW